jgi:hypothetical protein
VITVGIDPHKSSLTAVAVDATGHQLVSRVVNSAAVGGQAVEDFVGGLGPYEWLGVLVPCLDPGPHIGFQGFDAAVGAAAQLAVGQLGEPSLYQAALPRQAGQPARACVGRRPGRAAMPIQMPIQWREGSKDALASRLVFLWVRVAGRKPRLCQDGSLPLRWVIAGWPDDESEPVKYWISNLSEDTHPAEWYGWQRFAGGSSTTTAN